MIERTDLTDLLAVDGDSLALKDETLYRLGPVGTAILEAAAEPIDVDDLVRTLEETFGTPPEGSVRDAVEDQVQQLRTAGLLLP